MIPTQTLSRFIYLQERNHPGSSGELSDLLSSIVLGVKIITNLISTAGFKGLYGYTGKENVQGEMTQILDQEADETLVQALGSSGHFGLLVSEERDTVMATETHLGHAKYVVAFDPLDGSSNLGSNIPVGTIFGIWRRKDHNRLAGPEDFFQSGRRLVAAGYAIYGSKTSFVYSCGYGVHGFTLDPGIGEFILTEESIKMPARGKIYSVNEGNCHQWNKEMMTYVEELKAENKERQSPYTARYVGSLVADFDRNMRQGGVYIYPSDRRHPRGKLRLLYECIPLSYIAEQAGGRAIDGSQDILDITPSDIHERCPLIIGSPYEIQWFEEVRDRLRR